MANKRPPLDLAAAMEADLAAHDPMSTRPHEPQSPAPHETMSKMAGQPMASADHEDMTGSAHEQESAPSHEPMRTGRLPGSYVAPSRAGMKRVQGYFSPRVKRQLRLLAVNADVSEEELVGRALDLLFRAEGLPEIAFDGKGRGKEQPGEEP